VIEQDRELLEAAALANNSELTPETWANFVDRLRHDCVGDGVDDHYTADAIFIVQARRLIYGIDRDYSDKVCVIVEDSCWHSPMEYWSDLDYEEQESLDRESVTSRASTFTELTEWQQWSILGDLPDHTVTCWDERWEYVNAHFTKDAAEAFIRRKKHDYRDGLRVYVDAQTYCWEYNAIKAAILNGQIGFVRAAAAMSEGQEG